MRRHDVTRSRTYVRTCDDDDDDDDDGDDDGACRRPTRLVYRRYAAREGYDTTN